MVPYWLVLGAILLASLLIAMIVRFLLGKFFSEPKDANVFVFCLIMIGGMYFLLEFFGKHVAIVRSAEDFGHYVVLWPTDYVLDGSVTIKLDPGKLPNNSVINGTTKPLRFELVGYTKTGDISIMYGKVSIAPMSIERTLHYPDYVFSNPPESIWLWQSSSSGNEPTIRGWLHE